MEELRAIARYISEEFRGARKIVEIGVGNVPVVAAELRRLLPACDLVITDIEVPQEIPAGVRFARDDVTEPNLDIYRGADLLYSIRPPPELHVHILRVSRDVGAPLLLKPTSDEDVPGGGRVVNYRGATFYLFT